jgi:hypothetical protein
VLKYIGNVSLSLLVLVVENSKERSELLNELSISLVGVASIKYEYVHEGHDSTDEKRST